MQTSLTTSFPVGVAGQLADEHTAQFGDVVTRTNGGAAEMRFGIFTKRGASGDLAALLAANTDVPDGVVVHNHMYDYPTERGDTGLKQYATLDLLRKGRVYVLLETDVAIGDEVHVRATVNGGNTTLGICRATADGAHTIDLTEIASWQSAGVAGDIAILEIDMTGAAAVTADS